MKRSRIDMTHAPDLGEAIDAMRKRTVSLAWLAALTGLLALTACDSATNAGMGTVQLYLASSGGAAMVNSLTMDPPSATLADPRVLVVSAELIPGRQEIADFGPSGQWFSLTPGENDVSALLGSAAIPAGDYTQLRLVLADATVDVGTEQDVPLVVPSGTQTGVKFNFPSPVHVEEGVVTNLVVVFNIDESFVVTGSGRVLFKPVIHASVIPGLSIAGNVSMDVAAAADADTWVEVEATQSGTVVSSASVKIERGTGANIAVPYVLQFLPSGDYVVQASLLGCTAPTVNVTVPSDPPQTANFALDCTP
jgi:hypothetical protein